MKTLSGRSKHLFYCLLFIICSKADFGQSCPVNIDFESGNFLNWQCYIGDVTNYNSTNTISVRPSASITGRHTLIDRSYANVLDTFGHFPVLCPNGSGFSVKLGNKNANHEAERLSYTFTIPPGENEYSIVYQYAVVFQDPQHLPWEQPRFTARVFDVATNEYISCATYEYVATSNLPGFARSDKALDVWYKNWTPVTINLSGYAGRTIILEFTTGDCTLGGHFGYAYVDVNSGCNNLVSGASFCPDAASVTLNAPYGYKNYSWYTKDFKKKLGQNSSLTLTPPFTTDLAIDIIPFPGFGCRDTVYAKVKPVSFPPVTDKNVLICPGTQKTIGINPVSGYSYKWQAADGLTNDSVANPFVSPVLKTNYILHIKDDQFGCSTADTISVNIAPLPSTDFTIAGVSAQCITGNLFRFRSPVVSGSSYLWKFGDGSSSSQLNPEYSYAHAGTYTVTMIAGSALGCTDSSTEKVKVYGLPSGKIFYNSSRICPGTPVVLTVNGGVSYNWYKDSLKLPGTANTFDALQPGAYSVEIIDSNGCKSLADNAVPLSMTVKPEADFSYDKYCIGTPVSFLNKSILNNSLPVRYDWDFGNGNSSQLEQPPALYTATGVYLVKLLITPVNCPQLYAAIEKNITIENPLPGITYAPMNAVEDKPLELKARTIGREYEWIPASFLNNNTLGTPVFTGTVQQTYSIRMLTKNGCITVDTQTVRIFKEREIYVPRAFTPNNDGQNDRMFPFLVGIAGLKVFRILNRWGVLLYESRSALPGWDGTYKGMPQPVDGYVWEAEATDQDGKIILRKGTFTLLR